MGGARSKLARAAENWLPMAPSVEKADTQAPQAPAAAWTDEEIKTALMQCVQALAPITADVAPLAPIRNGDCGSPRQCF